MTLSDRREVLAFCTLAEHGTRTLAVLPLEFDAASRFQARSSAANKLKLRVIGTAGVLVLAKERQLIDSVRAMPGCTDRPSILSFPRTL